MAVIFHTQEGFAMLKFLYHALVFVAFPVSLIASLTIAFMFAWLLNGLGIGESTAKAFGVVLALVLAVASIRSIMLFAIKHEL